MPPLWDFRWSLCCMLVLITKCYNNVVEMVQTWYKQCQHWEMASLSPFNFPTTGASSRASSIFVCVSGQAYACLIYGNLLSLSS